MALMGIDVGSSGCKAIVFSNSGQQLAESYIEYPSSDNPYEIDGSLIWENVKAIIKSCTEKCDEKITAICVSSFGESFVPVDKDGNVLMKTMLYTDKRGRKECDFLIEKLGKQKIMEIAGTTPQPMYSLPKMMHIKENFPDIYDKTYKFLLIGSFIIYKLSGETVTDYSLAARTMAFDIIKKEWSQTLLECAGIGREKLTRALPSGTVAGEVKAEIALELGLDKNGEGKDKNVNENVEGNVNGNVNENVEGNVNGNVNENVEGNVNENINRNDNRKIKYREDEKIKVVTGGHDQICAALGAGVIDSTVAIDGTGTVECITPIFSGPILSEEFLGNNYACVPYVIDGMYATYAFNFTGGAILKWYKNNFAQYESLLAKEQGISVYKLLDENASKTPTDLIVIPHFAGSATPDMNENARGALLGMKFDTTASEIYRGLIEGVTYEMVYNMEILEASGIVVKELRAVGGGAKSTLWLQIKADITGKTIVSLETQEAGIVGAAILAGVATGVYRSLEEAITVFVKKGKKFEPDPSVKEIYDKNYQRYKTVRKIIGDIY